MSTELIEFDSAEPDLALQRSPEMVLAEATRAAQALRGVIESKPRKVIINQEQYLEFEDWQTLGRFYGISAQVVGTSYLELGKAQGYEASAEAIHTASGKCVSRAEAMCLNDEEQWQDKPLFQLRSMAQTRACAKAFRNCLAWIVVLAGYRPTPAEEMIAKEGEHKGEYWCGEHQTLWFKKGKMKTYAHPVEGTGKWCSMPACTSADRPTAEKVEDEVVYTPTSQGSPLDPKVERSRLEKELKAVLLDRGIDSKAYPVWMYQNCKIRDITKATPEELFQALQIARGQIEAAQEED